ncbi:MAG: hypothetical protein GWO02_17090 [Gammaproteobacteria bacterium]|nr:hypothetical protein [Gammaproteobacteria bacterium]
MQRALGLGPADWAGVAVFVGLWAGSVGYLAISGGDWTFPLISLGVSA